MNMFKTTTAKNQEEYIAMVDDVRRPDVQRLNDLIRKHAPKLEPFIASGMLAYGPFHYKSKSGREGEWMRLALAAQKNYISFYVCVLGPKGGYLADDYRDRLPKADIGKSCVRFKRLSDLDEKVLVELIEASAVAPAMGEA